MKLVTAILLTIAVGSSMQAIANPTVISQHLEKITTIELDSLPPWPEGTVTEGINQHWQKELHRGEVAVVIYEAMPAVIDISEPYPYDEFVVVLEGEVILTELDGSAQSYKTGDSFTVPKGWRGTWDMPVKYRELIVVETKAWEASGE